MAFLHPLTLLDSFSGLTSILLNLKNSGIGLEMTTNVVVSLEVGRCMRRWSGAYLVDISTGILNDGMIGQDIAHT